LLCIYAQLRWRGATALRDMPGVHVRLGVQLRWTFGGRM